MITICITTLNLERLNLEHLNPARPVVGQVSEFQREIFFNPVIIADLNFTTIIIRAFVAAKQNADDTDPPAGG